MVAEMVRVAVSAKVEAGPAPPPWKDCASSGWRAYPRPAPAPRGIVTVAATLAIAGLAGPASGEPGAGSPASCLGYLASNANPNNGFVIHAVVKPTAADLGVPMGALQSGIAQQHSGSLLACIP
jgi:hypothetical protein